MLIHRQIATKAGKRRAVSCADPYHETLEAIRWARELLASGRARAFDIGIATTAPGAWDDYMLALNSTSNLPLCFVHGRPALATRDGQRCAALADALRGGLSQARVSDRSSFHRTQSIDSRYPSENPALRIPHCQAGVKVKDRPAEFECSLMVHSCRTKSTLIDPSELK